VALVLSTAGASVAESTSMELQASAEDLALARSQASESRDHTAALAERRTAVTDQEALLQGRQQEADRIAREQERLALEKKKAEEAAKKKAEEERKKAEEAERQAEAARERAEEEARRSGKRYVAPIKRYKYTSGFGSRWGQLHAGADLAAPIGTPLYAISSGTVIKAAHTGSCGNNVWIEQWDGSVSRYCHMDYMSVRVGQRVAPGEKIGGTGNTGRSYGPHLHFEIRPGGEDGNPVDPIGWMRSKGVSL
jgi:murein DD-endopeptidase MepM/ murein hydrolase activator NlpD